MKSTTAALIVVAAVAVCAVAIPLQPPAEEAEAPEVPFHLEFSNAPSILPDRYIFVFKRDLVAEVVNRFADRFAPLALAGEFKLFNIGKLRGFHGAFRSDTVRAMRREGRGILAYIERDQEWHTLHETQADPTWGLDRTDQRDLPLDNQYRYSSHQGAGVDVYIIDTGININHVDFEGRASFGFNGIPREEDDDLNGHGTHCASTAAGVQWGIAKKANIIAVKVMSRFGLGSGNSIIDGIEYVAQSGRPGNATVNMSLGTGAPQQVIDDAVNEVVDMGIVFVAAAGNSDADACTSSPARAEKTICVAASNNKDERAWFSNWGSCVDLFAPGEDIEAAWVDGPESTTIISGTSMAAPHVCGATALLLAENPGATPAQIEEMVIKNATPDKITDVKGSPNMLLYAPFQ